MGSKTLGGIENLKAYGGKSGILAEPLRQVSCAEEPETVKREANIRIFADPLLGLRFEF